MRGGEIVFDGKPEHLTDDTAREIYVAEAAESFEVSITSTSLTSGLETPDNSVAAVV